jgi:hypothetical protein
MLVECVGNGKNGDRSFEMAESREDLDMFQVWGMFLIIFITLIILFALLFALIYNLSGEFK